VPVTAEGLLSGHAAEDENAAFRSDETESRSRVSKHCRSVATPLSDIGHGLIDSIRRY
jgi:hypothetical protein